MSSYLCEHTIPLPHETIKIARITKAINFAFSRRLIQPASQPATRHAETTKTIKII